MNTALYVLSFVAGTLAFVASALERRAARRFVVADLIEARFGRPHPRDILPGLAAGVLAVAVPFGLYLSKGWLEISFNNLPVLFVPLALATLAVKFLWAAMEELIYRGALLPQVERRSNAAIALVVSSFLFAFAHLERTGARTPNGISLAVYGLDGIGFGLGWLATGNLWMPGAWHFAKNISIWLLYGTGAFHLTPGPLNVGITGPPLWMGNDNQAGVVDLIVTSLVVVLVLLLYRRRLAAAAGRAEGGAEPAKS